jgi:hypothetical protein
MKICHLFQGFLCYWYHDLEVYKKVVYLAIIFGYTYHLA